MYIGPHDTPSVNKTDHAAAVVTRRVAVFYLIV